MANDIDIIDTNTIVPTDISEYSISKDILKTKIKKVLFDQVILEEDRISNTRSLLNRLEDKIFTDEFLDSLNPQQKVELYKILSSSSSSILETLIRIQTSFRK